MIKRLKGIIFVLSLFLTSFLGSLFFLLPIIPFLFFKPLLYRSIVDIIVYYWFLFVIAMVENFLGIEVLLEMEKGACINIESKYLIIMNHYSRVDWLFFWSCLYRLNFLLSHKIILKAPLKYLPGAGWAMQMANFVFLKRHWEDDKNVLNNSITYLSNLDYPLKILLYPEGTDFSPNNICKNKEYAIKHNLQIYHHLLQPRIKGFTYLVQLMKKKNIIDRMLDVTVSYHNADYTEKLYEYHRENEELSESHSDVRPDPNNIFHDDAHLKIHTLPPHLECDSISQTLPHQNSDGHHKQSSLIGTSFDDIETISEPNSPDTSRENWEIINGNSGNSSGDKSPVNLIIDSAANENVVTGLTTKFKDCFDDPSSGPGGDNDGRKKTKKTSKKSEPESFSLKCRYDSPCTEIGILKGLYPDVVKFSCRSIELNQLPADSSEEMLGDWLKQLWASKDEILNREYDYCHEPSNLEDSDSVSTSFEDTPPQPETSAKFTNPFRHHNSRIFTRSFGVREAKNARFYAKIFPILYHVDIANFPFLSFTVTPIERRCWFARWFTILLSIATPYLLISSWLIFVGFVFLAVFLLPFYWVRVALSTYILLGCFAFAALHFRYDLLLFDPLRPATDAKPVETIGNESKILTNGERTGIDNIAIEYAQYLTRGPKASSKEKSS